MLVIDQLAEARIIAAIERGELADLPGAGKPVILDDDSHVPAQLRVAYRLLKNAGCLPPELELRREITHAEQLLANMNEDTDKTHAATRISYLMTQLGAARGRGLDLRSEQAYFEKIHQRLEAR